MDDQGMEVMTNIWELIALGGIAVCCSAVAWAVDAELFAEIFGVIAMFAAATAISWLGLD